jgi:RhtB (resistance to homoserine/threonine) family protein
VCPPAEDARKFYFSRLEAAPPLWNTARIGGHLLIFVGVAAIVIITPGPDMVLVTKNAVMHGRRAALGTSLGVNTGLAVWTVASALGVASLVRASALAFTILKLVGAAYLIWLGLHALLSARRHWSPDSDRRDDRGQLDARLGFRQGLFSNLAHPKIAVFFTSLLPQFIGPTRSVLVPFLLLGGLFVAMTAVWLCSFALVAARASSLLKRPRVKATLDRVTGVVLIGLGLRLASERR